MAIPAVALEPDAESTMRRVPVVALSLVAALALAGGAAPARSAPRDTAGQQRAPRTAVLDGVVNDSVGNPLEGAVVTIDAVRQTVITGAGGRFRIDSLPSDTIDVAVRRLGFAPAYFAVAIPQGKRVSVAVRMLPSLVKLGTIVVEGESRDLRLQREGFYDRKRRGRGVLLGPKFMAPRRGLHASSVFREIPRIQVACAGGGMRGCVPLLKDGVRACVPDLFLDGTVIPRVGLD